MKEKLVLELLNDDLLPKSQVEARRVEKLDHLVRRQSDSWLDLGGPDRRHEKERLRDISRTGLLGLIVDYCSQQISATNVISERGEDAARSLWKPWDRNGMPSRQGGLYTASLMYGASYLLVLPGTVPSLDGPVSQAYMRPFSPDSLYCVYGDLVDDEHPMFALRTIQQRGKQPIYRLYDEEFEYFIGNEDGQLVYLEAKSHSLGVCPVVRFGVNVDLNGETLSEPEKHRLEAQKYETTARDRLYAQRYNSWKVRTATGLESVDDEDEREQRKTLLAQEDILAGEGDVKFGTLDETNLDPLVHAEEFDRDMLAAVSQTPVWAFNGGQLVNLAAEALKEAKTGNRQKVQGFQRGFGRSIADSLRLSAAAEGRAVDAYDFSLTPTWKDIDDPTLSQAFDAWGKGVEMLGIPQEETWDKLPGVSHQEALRWKTIVENTPSEADKLTAALRRQGEDSGQYS